MMNRGVLERQMFANGGQAVPNEYKGFSKLPEAVQMRMDPVAAKKYQEGGPVEQGVGSMMQMPADPSQAAPVDPQIVEGLLTDAASEVQDLENVEDYETMINAIRGDELPMEARREELAELVGPEDAAQTPDSVLALAQPAIVMASVDEGIGGLAQAEMTQEVSGPMAGGIMSTVAPPQPAAPGPEMMGGPPPVNFKEGGLVRRGDNQPVQMYANGGETIADFRRSLNIPPPVNAFPVLSQANAPVRVTPPPAPLPPPAPARGDGSRLRELVDAQKDIYREYGLGDPAARAAELESQKDLTKAQMLFDIAQTALTFAAPMQGERAGMSAAERLAMAASATQLPQTIGARAQTLAEQKRAAAKEERALDLAALQSAETKLAAEVAAEDALKLARAKPKKASFINVLDKSGTKNLGSFDISTAEGRTAAEKLLSENEGSFSTTNMPREPKEKDIVLYNAATGAQSPIFDKNSEQGKADMQAWRKANPLPEGESYMMLKPPTAPTPDKPITERAFFDKFGFSFAAFKDLSPDMQNHVRGLPVLTDKDYFAKYGVTKAEFSALDQETQKFMMGLPVLTDKDYFNKYGMTKQEFMDLPTETKNRLSRVAPERKTTTVNGQIIDITEGTSPVAIFGDKDVKTVTLDGEVLDITNPADVKVIYGDKDRDIRIVKGQLVEVPADGGEPVPIFGERTPTTGTFENMILANGKSVIVKKVGSTLYDTNGEVIDLASDTYKDAVIVSKDTAFTASKTATRQADAQQKLDRLDQVQGDDRLSGQLRGQDDVITQRVEALGGSLSPRIEAVSFDALRDARKGVGFYNKIKQSISEVGGSLVPALRLAFQDEVAAGNFIDTINIIGRVGLANSPRYAEGEQTRLAKLFPDTESLLANPENAVLKLIGLKRVMQFEYRQNLKLLAQESDSVLVRQAQQANYAIESVLKMLETIPDRGVVSDDSVDATIEALRRSRGQVQ